MGATPKSQLDFEKAQNKIKNVPKPEELSNGFWVTWH